MTFSTFVNKNTLTYISQPMGHETFSIFCDGLWNFVEEFRMGHLNFWGPKFSESFGVSPLSVEELSHGA